MTQDIQVYTSSGNVFEDLGFVNADEMLAKAELIRQITLIIQQRQLTDQEVAQLFEIKAFQVTELVQGKLLKFSTDSLIRFLKILGMDIEIIVKNTSSTPGKVTVVNTESSFIIS